MVSLLSFYISSRNWCNVLAADLQKERDDRIRAESRAANLEREVNMLQLDLKNINQKLERVEEEYQISQKKVMYWKCRERVEMIYP